MREFFVGCTCIVICAIMLATMVFGQSRRITEEHKGDAPPAAAVADCDCDDCDCCAGCGGATALKRKRK